MAVIKGNSDPYWHEKHLLLLALRRGPLEKGELFEKVRKEQEKRVVLGETGVSHSESAYRYWLRTRENQWVIAELGNGPELTALGQWIVDSELGTFLDRDNFIELLCPKCSKAADLALLTPSLDTAQTNAKGRLFMHVECPRCQYRVNRMPMTGELTQEQFISFYNAAIEGLRRCMKIKARNI